MILDNNHHNTFSLVWLEFLGLSFFSQQKVLLEMGKKKSNHFISVV